MSETWSRIDARSRARSLVEPYRSSGSLARQRSMDQTRLAGAFGLTTGRLRVVLDDHRERLDCVARPKARRPVTIS